MLSIIYFIILVQSLTVDANTHIINIKYERTIGYISNTLNICLNISNTLICVNLNEGYDCQTKDNHPVSYDYVAFLKGSLF